MGRARGRTAAGATLLLALLGGCGRTVDAPPPPEPDAVVFRIEAIESSHPGRIAWRATYRAGDRIARFRIELEPEPKGAKLPAFVHCALLRETESDASVLLHELARALNGRVPPSVPGVPGLDAVAALLGRDLSRGGRGNVIAGRFGSEPKGTWLATKLFLGDDEVFLDLDPIGGYGDLALKDPAFGPGVLRRLGSLLQGESQGALVDLDVARATPPPAAPTPEPAQAAMAARVAALSRQAARGAPQPERRSALEALASIGVRAGSATPVFLEALTDEDAIIRGAAVRGFPRLRPDPQAGIAAVTPLLKDADPVTQVGAAEALAEFGEVPLAATYLTVFLKGRAKTFAAAGLMKLGPGAVGAVPLLTEMLEQRQDPQQGYAACMALSAVGRDAASALPALRAAAGDVNPSVREAAALAIRRIEIR